MARPLEPECLNEAHVTWVAPCDVPTVGIHSACGYGIKMHGLCSRTATTHTNMIKVYIEVSNKENYACLNCIMLKKYVC